MADRPGQIYMGWTKEKMQALLQAFGVKVVGFRTPTSGEYYIPAVIVLGSMRTPRYPYIMHSPYLDDMNVSGTERLIVEHPDGNQGFDVLRSRRNE